MKTPFGFVVLFHDFPLFICVRGNAGTHVSSPQHTVQWCECACQCILLWRDIEPPAESDRLTDDHKVTRLTDLWSLWRYTHTSREFPALFLSFSLIWLLFSPPTLSSVVFFYLSLTLVCSQCSSLYPVSHLSPLLPCSLFSLMFLPSVSLLLKWSLPVSLSVFPPVVHDFPADWGDYCIIARC